MRKYIQTIRCIIIVGLMGAFCTWGSFVFALTFPFSGTNVNNVNTGIEGKSMADLKADMMNAISGYAVDPSSVNKFTLNDATANLYAAFNNGIANTTINELPYTTDTTFSNQDAFLVNANQIGAYTTSNNSSLTFSNVQTGFSAIDNGGGYVALIAKDAGSGFIFANNNNSGTRAAAFQNETGASSATATAFIEKTTFVNNQGAYEGAVYNRDGSLMIIRDSAFTGNISTGSYAGALHNDNYLYVQNTDFINNQGRVGAISNGGYAVLEDINLNSNTGPTSGAIQNGNTIVLAINSNDRTYTGNTASLGGFLYNSSGTFTFSINNYRSLTIGDNNSYGSQTRDSISGTGVINKIGNGTLTLHADSSSFQGSFNVNEGTLVMGNADNNLTKLGGTVSVLSGATLIGTGTIGSSGRISTIYGDLTVGYQNKVGTIASAGSLSITSGATPITLRIDGSNQTYDSIITAQNLNIDRLISIDSFNGTTLVDELSNFDDDHRKLILLNAGDTYTLTYGSIDFNSLTDNYGRLWEIGFDNSLQELFIFTNDVIPEPSAYAFIAITATLSMTAARRRRNNR